MRIATIIVLFLIAYTYAEEGDIPADNYPYFYSIGLGIGPSYGGGGIKGSFGYEYVSLDLAGSYLGVGAGFNGGLTGYFSEKHSSVRPKLSAFYMNYATIVIPEDIDIKDGKMYPGIGIFGGVDFKLGRSSMFYVDTGIGYVHTFKKYDDIRKEWEEKGYMGNSFPDEPSRIRIFVGFGVSGGRQYK